MATRLSTAARNAAANAIVQLIDAGPAKVYEPHLKPRLAEIRKARGLTANASLPVDLLMVSHIDDEHIKGVIELTKELIETEAPPPVKIKGVWHNTFDDIIGNNPEKLTRAVTAQFGTASLSGEGVEVEGLDPDAAKVLARGSSVEEQDGPSRGEGPSHGEDYPEGEGSSSGHT